MQKGTDLHLLSKVYGYTEVRLKFVPNWAAVHENLSKMVCFILVLLLLHLLILPVLIFMIPQWEKQISTAVTWTGDRGLETTASKNHTENLN